MGLAFVLRAILLTQMPVNDRAAIHHVLLVVLSLDVIPERRKVTQLIADCEIFEMTDTI